MLMHVIFILELGSYCMCYLFLDLIPPSNLFLRNARSQSKFASLQSSRPKTPFSPPQYQYQRLRYADDQIQSRAIPSASEDRTLGLLVQLHHHIRNLHILLILVLSRDLENDVLLVVRDGFAADGFDELGHPKSHPLLAPNAWSRDGRPAKAKSGSVKSGSVTYFMGNRSCNLLLG